MGVDRSLSFSRGALVLALGVILALSSATAGQTGSMETLDGHMGAYVDGDVVADPSTLAVPLVIPWKPVPGETPLGYNTVSISFDATHVGDDLAAAIASVSLCPVTVHAAEALPASTCVDVMEPGCGAGIGPDGYTYCVDPAPTALEGLAQIPPRTVAIRIVPTNNEMGLRVGLVLSGSTALGPAAPFTVRVHGLASTGEVDEASVTFTIVAPPTGCQPPAIESCVPSPCKGDATPPACVPCSPATAPGCVTDEVLPADCELPDTTGCGLPVECALPAVEDCLPPQCEEGDAPPACLPCSPTTAPGCVTDQVLPADCKLPDTSSCGLPLACALPAIEECLPPQCDGDDAPPECLPCTPDTLPGCVTGDAPGVPPDCQDAPEGASPPECLPCTPDTLPGCVTGDAPGVPPDCQDTPEGASPPECLPCTPDTLPDCATAGGPVDCEVTTAPDTCVPEGTVPAVIVVDQVPGYYIQICTEGLRPEQATVTSLGHDARCGGDLDNDGRPDLFEVRSNHHPLQPGPNDPLLPDIPDLPAPPEAAIVLVLGVLA